METRKLIEYLTANISTVSSKFDHRDAEVRIFIFQLASGRTEYQTFVDYNYVLNA